MGGVSQKDIIERRGRLIIVLGEGEEMEESQAEAGGGGGRSQTMGIFPLQRARPS